MSDRTLFCFAFVALWTAPALAADRKESRQPTIEVFIDGRVFVGGLSTDELTRLTQAKLTPDQWTALLAVHAEGVGQDQPPMLGSYHITDGKLIFRPRFPPTPGLRGRVVLHVAKLPGRKNTEPPITLPLQVPARPVEKTTVVEQVYPTIGTLPENQLKFYLHFSAPMSRGEAYKHIRLLDAAGKPIDLPFLELDQELWDPEGRRFTLFFDPGRIKRGLKSREEAGPSLEEGKSYTLVIDSNWADAAGNPLKESHRKKFSVTAPDDQPINPSTWKLHAPTTARTEPLILTFPKPFDHALLQRLIWVVDSKGNKVAGTVAVSEQETRWQFTPTNPWHAEGYSIIIDTQLEDLAGNNLEKPFEIDVFKPIQRKLKGKTVPLKFEVKKAEG